MNEPIVVEFPLKGEWMCPNTPGTKIPSHGTNKFGTTYAYDFIQVDWNRIGYPAYKVSFLRYLLFGLSLDKYFCWGQRIYAPFDGIVEKAEDGYKERSHTYLLSDMFRAFHNAKYFDPQRNDIRMIAGNYVIIKNKDKVYAALCHLKTDSIQVTVGQKVKKGDYIGNIGHSGNSYAPHLHFQLMDNCDISIAKGLPCVFEKYELQKDGIWMEIRNGIPKNRDRIRRK